jgi:hypothetical protein
MKTTTESVLLISSFNILYLLFLYLHAIVLFPVFSSGNKRLKSGILLACWSSGLLLLLNENWLKRLSNNLILEPIRVERQLLLVWLLVGELVGLHSGWSLLHVVQLLDRN